MPPMKPGFQSKESLQRKTQELQYSLSNTSPQINKGKGKFFSNHMQPKTNSNSSNGNGSSKIIENNGNANGNGPHSRKTNTLSYSETIGPQTMSIYGRKTDISDMNTVFGITLKENQTGHQNCDDLQVSAHFGGSGFKNKEMNESHPEYLKLSQGKSHDSHQMAESQHSTVKSEFIDQIQIEEGYSQKIARIPELRCNWFQFYTDVVYCSVSSLVLIINNIEYNVPFGLAKSLLASRRNLELFLLGTTFTNQGEVQVDASFLEQIKGTRLEEENYVSEEEIKLDSITAKLM